MRCWSTVASSVHNCWTCNWSVPTERWSQDLKKKMGNNFQISWTGFPELLKLSGDQTRGCSEWRSLAKPGWPPYPDLTTAWTRKCCLAVSWCSWRGTSSQSCARTEVWRRLYLRPRSTHSNFPHHLGQESMNQPSSSWRT